MNPTLMAGTISSLENDATLRGYIGTGNVFRARRAAPEQIPSVTVKSGTEQSKNQCGAIITRRRNSSSIVQIDIWVSSEGSEFPCTGEDADLIQVRVEEVLLNPLAPVTGTRAWEKITESQQEGEGLWHNVIRFAFDYGQIDS
jgi:hypothetical protein